MDLDRLLTREIGQFGRFQWRLLAMAVIVAIAMSCNTGEFVFTTARITTRCLITECEVPGDTEFSPLWLANAIPSYGDTFDSCQHYAIRTLNVTSNVTITDDGKCPAFLFDPSITVPCEQYVFENKHTVVYDLELACDEWRRSLIGSARTLAMLIAFPITGIVSDQWGRRTALVITAFNGAFFGTLRCRANTYIAFIFAQFVEAALGTGKFTCIYVMLLEVVGPKYRVRAGAATNTSIALGHMILALLAWVFPYWKNLTLAIYVPQFLFILYYWIAPESIRWYQSKGKFEKAAESIKKVAKVNGKSLSENTLLELKNIAESQRNTCEDKKEDEPWLIVQVFQNKPMLTRCLISPILFITASLVYYGLSINAVNLVGNKYLNYALVAVVDIPGIWLAVLLMDRVGRRPVLSGAFGLCALCQLCYIFLSKDVFVVSLLMYLMGKCCISAVNTTLAIYTNELYPTRYRHRMYAFSATMGSIGMTLAPLTPALGATVSASLPFMLFGGMALLSGLLVRLLPETLGTHLPDTMLQAADIGREDSLKNDDM